MHLALLLAIFAYPLLELALLIRAGQLWGLLAVLTIILATGALGVAILRRQGFRTAEKLQAELKAGQTPLATLADSGMIFAAGALLVSPGLIGDAAGLLLLIAPVRMLIRKAIASKIETTTTVVVETSTRRQEQGARSQPGDPPVIEGEWERIDEKPPKR